MKKIITILFIGLFIISGLGASANLTDDCITNEISSISDFFTFYEPIITTRTNSYIGIELPGSNGQQMMPGEPLLPNLQKTYTFPFGTQIKNIEVKMDGIKQYTLTNKIIPTPSPVTSINGIETSANDIGENEVIYNSNSLYPNEHYTYSLHAGLDGTKHVIILNLRCHPIQYSPNDNKLYVSEELSIDITYESSVIPVSFADEYDMVIIAPRKFSLALNPLIEHKKSVGIQTILKTTESIYDEYTGRDQPEKIKYFIKDAIENWNISYVLLCGGKKSILFGNWGVEGPYLSDDSLWEVPVRYNTLLDSTGEAGCLTDLYFSDIYKIEGGNPVFDDWDSDENNIFAQWTLHDKDVLDLYPDVYVGRLACRNIFEVKIMVNKIINYESTSADPSWFKKIVGVGGDSFNDTPPLGDDYFEGEERNKIAAEYLGDFTPVWCWASNKDTGDPVPSTFHILQAVNKGCGFLYFAGHGNPYNYDTHWFHNYGWSDTPGGLDIYDMLLIHNGKKLPICMIGSCHNSEFNVSLFDMFNNPLLYGTPTPECWSWTLTRKITGGSIATIGYTGLEWVATYGWDTDDIPDCIQYYSGYIDSRFYYAYGVDSINFLGEACGHAINDYLDRFPCMTRKWDCKTVQQWHLLGDPSLMIGGYPE